MKIILAGPYPEGTREQFKALLPHHQIVSVLTQQAYDEVRDAECIIVRILKTPAAIFADNPSLKGVIRWGAGYDSVDIEAAGKQGVLVANTPGANAQAVAELALGLMIALNRKLIAYAQNVMAGNWDRGAYSSQSYTLNQKIVGIVGGGNIGRKVAASVQTLGAQVLYYDKYRLPYEQERNIGMTYTPLNELLSRADLVSLHIPLLDDTRHMIGAEALSLMKPTAYLINTARGGLVDEKALLDALTSGHLAGAGLDCIEDEASPIVEQLTQNPHVIVTPHIGGTTADLAQVMIPLIAEKIASLAQDGTMTDVVNRHFLPERFTAN